MGLARHMESCVACGQHKFVTTYKRYRNFCNNLIKKIKRAYDKNLFLESKNNIKATWNAIKSINNTNCGKQKTSELLNINPVPSVSVGMVNQAFVNVGRDLASKISPCAQRPSTPKYGLSSPIGNSLVILPVDNAQVERLVKSLRSNCATGWDDIPAKILKNSSDVLVPPITHLCNLAINSGIFPLALKNAIVHPIYKSGDKESVTNYRPISVLSSISKILERILNNCLTEYLDKYHIIARNQYGFRAGVSTEDAVADFSCAVVSKLDKQFKCYGIFLDLSKAFDTVSVPILMTKLEQIGIRGITLQLFCDYLTDRSQCVKIDSYVSKNEPLSYGVPQGSILGPTLFLVYINDLCTLKMPNTEIFTYADDTALLIYDVDWESAKLRAESSLRVVMEWLSSNLLTLNLSKTQYLCFNISNRVKQNSDLRIKAHYCSTSTNCQCPTIGKTDSIRYLGVILDDKLNWGSHINSLCKRVRRLIYLFKNLRHCLDKETLITVYKSLCESILSYCIPIWGGTYKTYMLPLERAQRAVLKVLLSKPRDYATVKVYSEAQVLTVRQIYLLRTVLRRHSYLPLDAKVLNRRQGFSVCELKSCRTVFAHSQLDNLSSRVYNKINKSLHIYPLNKFEIKCKLKSWLSDLSYEETEKLLTMTS